MSRTNGIEYFSTYVCIICTFISILYYTISVQGFSFQIKVVSFPLLDNYVDNRFGLLALISIVLRGL